MRTKHLHSASTGSVTRYVGLDYADSVVQVCVLDRTGRVLSNRPVCNDAAELDRRVRRFGGSVRAALEACSGAAHLADELTQRFGWSVMLAHPGYVRRMKQNPDKTDHADAYVLADLVRLGYVPRVWLAPAAVRDLRHLVRYRVTQVRPVAVQSQQWQPSGRRGLDQGGQSDAAGDADRGGSTVDAF